jgi:hypothetical protein
MISILTYGVCLWILIYMVYVISGFSYMVYVVCGFSYVDRIVYVVMNILYVIFCVVTRGGKQIRCHIWLLIWLTSVSNTIAHGCDAH